MIYCLLILLAFSHNLSILLKHPRHFFKKVQQTYQIVRIYSFQAIDLLPGQINMKYLAIPINDDNYHSVRFTNVSIFRLILSRRLQQVAR